MKLHGAFHVPGSHGRLYEGWVLPDWVAGLNESRQEHLGRIVDQFNDTIEEAIITVLRSPRRSRNPPDESKAPSVAQLSSSTVGLDAVPVSIPTPAASRKSSLSVLTMCREGHLASV